MGHLKEMIEVNKISKKEMIEICKLNEKETKKWKEIRR